ncbi:MAG: cell division protein FtsA [Ignavibacteria bacterium]|nr:cell division protein FtsA [Ignavibacteria bacterium]
MKKNIVAALDIGTTKTCVVIAEKDQLGKFDILGVGISASEGILRGTVANISKVAESIKKAVNIAENKAGLKLTGVNIGVAGIHISSMRYRNYVTITNPEKEITENDLERLFNDVKMIHIPSDYFILHVIPEEYFVDDQGGIQDPIGMSGRRLEAANHIVLASINSTQNLTKAVERAELKVNNMILQPIASANAVLDESEKELGVVMIDIGGGTTDLAVYVNGSIRHSKVIGVAGSHVTNDIRNAFNIISEQAEKLKIEKGYASPKALIKEEDFYVQSGGPRAPIKISSGVLTQVIYLRMKELFMLIDHELTMAKLKDSLRGGIVLTGGGSLIKGCEELAIEVFGLPCRIGMPLDLGGGLAQKVESPVYATAVGLLFDGLESNKIKDKKSYVSRTKSSSNILKTVKEKIKDFFGEL